jgi:hypothetical protein
MKSQALMLALTIANSALLVFQFMQPHRTSAQEAAPVIRARALQIVDDQNRVRASLAVLPASVQKDGKRSAETVLLRLITERGRPSVKIGASEQEAVMALVGPSGTKDTYVQVGAKGTASSLRLKNEDGKEVFVKP